jgi:hypothetical protein
MWFSTEAALAGSIKEVQSDITEKIKYELENEM